MSTSTTATTEYTLTKYSRCYSSTSPGTQQGEQWQHFSNPVIKLSLDAKKRLSGELESYRLRIVWSIGAVTDAMDTDTREISFEDIDLFSFSSPEVMESQNYTGPASLPLKAVYRDAVVGIRYQHPRIIPQGTTPVYRRIQMNFENTSSANSFLDAIRLVCPCKENSGPAPPGRTMTMNLNIQAPEAAPRTQSASQAPTREVVENSQAAPSHSRTFMKPTSAFRRSVTKLPIHTTLASENPPPRLLPLAPRPTVDWDSLSASTFPTRSDDALRFNPVSQTSIPTPTGSKHIEVPRPRDEDPIPTDDIRPSNRRRIWEPDAPLPPSSLPDPSPPSSDTAVASGGLSSQPAEIPSLQRTSSPVPTPDSRAQILSSLQESLSMYDLPKGDLEELIARIVREERFTKLLETIDSLWRIKSVVGIQ